MKRNRLCALFVISGMLVGVSMLHADDTKLSSKDIADVLAKASAIVKVEYSLKYDRGDEPSGAGWATRCPNCGNYHGESDAGKYVKEERPFVTTGYLVAPDKVVTRDYAIHPRFIESIHVRDGAKLIKVRQVDWVESEPAVVLVLETTVRNRKPLTFDSTLEGPYFSISAQDANGRFALTCKPVSTTVSYADDGERFQAIEPTGLIVNKAGTPVALCMRSEQPIGDDWTQFAAGKSVIAADDVARQLKRFESIVNQGLHRVHLSLRSPKKGAQSTSYYGWDSDNGEEATEMNVPGVLIGNDRLLVLANLKRKVTARLKRVLVHPVGGKPVEATFVGSLEKYGCFIAKLESPLAGALTLDDSAIESSRHSLLLAAQVLIQGEQRVQYLDHARIASFDRRWSGKSFPSLAGEESNRYLFTLDGKLRAFAVHRRTPVSVESEWGGDEEVLLPSNLLAELLASIDQHFDKNNVPLSEEEENRLAWMGVELQSLDEELARTNKVSDLTKDGSIGGIVSFVYEGSPAEKAGIEMGDILIQLHIEGQPKPLEVNAGGSGYGFMSEFPWAQLGDLPEEYFDQIPSPWPSANNALNRSLTDAGFGKKYTADVFRDGSVNKMAFTIVEGPKHYDSAAKYNAKSIGLTVRDMTYELRRYFHISEGEPGVVISKIEPGSKASVAGLKPYELITHVGDTAVLNVEDFKTSIADRDELRMSVKRMTRGRIVTLRVPKGDADAGEAGDAEASEGADDDTNEAMEIE